MDIFSLIKRGGPITSKDLEPKIEDFIPNYNEIMNARNFTSPQKEIQKKSDGFTVVDNYKQSCPPMSKEAEKKEIMQAKEDLQKTLKEKIKDLEKWDDKAKSDVEKWFGSSDEITRQMLLERSKKMLNLLSSYTANNFKPAENSQKTPGLFAYTYPNDDTTVYLGDGFCNASTTGKDSKKGVLAHEMSHFDSISSTEDFGYGSDAIDLVNNPINGKPAIYNAENYEYYIEN